MNKISKPLLLLCSSLFCTYLSAKSPELIKQEYKSISLNGLVKVYEEYESIETGVEINGLFEPINSVFLIANYDTRSLSGFKKKTFAYGAGIRIPQTKGEDHYDFFGYLNLLNTNYQPSSNISYANQGYRIGAGYKVITPRVPDSITSMQFYLTRYNQSDFKIQDISFEAMLSSVLTLHLQGNLKVTIDLPLENSEISLGLKATY